MVGLIFWVGSRVGRGGGFVLVGIAVSDALFVEGVQAFSTTADAAIPIIFKKPRPLCGFSLLAYTAPAVRKKREILEIHIAVIVQVDFFFTACLKPA